jgi:hypothetical protein
MGLMPAPNLHRYLLLFLLGLGVMPQLQQGQCARVTASSSWQQRKIKSLLLHLLLLLLRLQLLQKGHTCPPTPSLLPHSALVLTQNCQTTQQHLLLLLVLLRLVPKAQLR